MLTNKKEISILILTFLLCLFHAVYPVYAAEDFTLPNPNILGATGENNDLILSLESNLATSPECMMDKDKLEAMLINIGIGVGLIIASYIAVGVGIGLAALAVSLSASCTAAITAAVGTAGILSGIPAIICPNAAITWGKKITIAVTAASLLASGIAMLVMEIGDALGYAQCVHSFVRDPVDHYPNFFKKNHPDHGSGHEGKMRKTVKVGKGFVSKPVQNVWEADPSDHSDQLTVCARSTDPRGIVSFEGCYRKGCGADYTNCGSGINSHLGWIGVIANTPYKVFEENPYYNGPNAILCPEEYRQVGRDAYDSPDTTGFRKIKCTKYVTKDCDPGTLAAHHQPYMGSFEDFKLMFARPDCKVGRDGDTVSLFDYKYKIEESAGGRLCAYLTHSPAGFKLSKRYTIGCINGPDTKDVPTPECPQSKPVYDNFELNKDTGEYINYGTETSDINGQIIKNKIDHYDNGLCLSNNSCSVSPLCSRAQSGLFKSPLPVTAYLMGCLKETMNNIVLGCHIDVPGSNKPITSKGMLGNMQSRLQAIIILLITLSIALMGMNIVYADSAPKIPEVFAYILKITAVIYFTFDSGTHNGMRTYSQYVSKISYALQSIVLNVSADRGLCDYSKVDYIVKNNVISVINGITNINSNIKDYSYLRVWDTVDCRLVYYFTSSFSNAASLNTPGGLSPWTPMTEGTIFHIVAAMFGINPTYWIFLITLILFAIFFLFIIIQICEIIIISLIGSSILIVLSPIFVPFLLFKSTKQMFDGWINQVITFALYPVMIFAFIGFMLLIMDGMIFGETKFNGSKEGWLMGRKVQIFNINESGLSGGSKDSCEGFSIATKADDISTDGSAYGKIPRGCDCSGTHCMLNSLTVKNKKIKQRDGEGHVLISNTTGADIDVTGAGLVQMFRNTIGLFFTTFIFYHLTKSIYGLLNSLAGTSQAMAGYRTTTPHERMEDLAIKGIGAATDLKDFIKRSGAPKKGASKETGPGPQVEPEIGKKGGGGAGNGINSIKSTGGIRESSSSEPSSSGGLKESDSSSSSSNEIPSSEPSSSGGLKELDSSFAENSPNATSSNAPASNEQTIAHSIPVTSKDEKGNIRY